jgi:hypothetical protein
MKYRRITIPTGTLYLPLALSPIERRPAMPLIPIILWVGVPVVLLGGGYMIVQMLH